uniref:Mutator-like transposase domain-containing protein n=1 Tax=Anopheles atroparvus TaxID=41427 RepID=A0A182JFH0_ANOAO
MMTRRKSVHESTLQAQLQLQERTVEEQQQASGLNPTGTVNALQATSAVPGTHNTSAVPLASTTSICNTAASNASFSSASHGGVYPSVTNTTLKSTPMINRSKTPRINKRSAPMIDGPSSSNAQASVTSSPQSASGLLSNNTVHGGASGGGSGGVSSGPIPNPMQQTLAQNGMDPDEIPKFKGYRIIEIDHFLQWAAYSQFMHSKHCPGGLLKPYQEYISGCYSTFAMKCSKCSAIITRSSENYIHHNKLMNRLVKGTVQMGKDYDEMQQFMESLEIPFVTRDEFQSIRGQVSSSLEDQSALQRAVEELERASVVSKRKRHGSCKYHYEVLKVYLNKKMKKIEENLQLSVNDSVALAVNAHLKNVSHVQLVPNGQSSNMNCAIIGGGGTIGGTLTGTNAIAGYGFGSGMNSIGSGSTSGANSGQLVAVNGTAGGNQRAGPGGMSLVAESNVACGSSGSSGRPPTVNRDQLH